MATLTISLPDELAEQARTLGLLEPHTLACLLRDGIRHKQIADLFDAADRLSELDLPSMTPEEVQAEILTARDEPRARRT
jgi:hypothetical protein